MTKRGLQTLFSNKRLLAIAYILLAMAIGALYPTSEYVPRWVNALLLGMYGALILSIMYRMSNGLVARGGKRLTWYAALVATALFFAVTSNDDGPWWLNTYYPMILSLIPLIIYEWFVGRHESVELTGGLKPTENMPDKEL